MTNQMNNQLTETEKAHAYLRCVEADIRKFLMEGDGAMALEYFEDVHCALIEAMNMLGVEIDPDDGDDMAEVIAEYDKRQDAIDLENFDPLEKKQ